MSTAVIVVDIGAPKSLFEADDKGVILGAVQAHTEVHRGG